MSDEPEFVEVDLTVLQYAGVLMAVNERLLWPLGLALTWNHDSITGNASDLHVREWRWDDGHHEAIELDESDEIGQDRRLAFDLYVRQRAGTMPEDERKIALELLPQW